MSDEPRMSPDGEYIQFQMDNPGMHDAPAPAGEFVECDTCRAKPGSPFLCRGCLHNRDAIAATEARVRAEVWGKCVSTAVRYAETNEYSNDTANTTGIVSTLESAALADGCDRTSLAKPE